MAKKIILAILVLVVVGIIAAVALGNKKESGTRVFTSEAKERTIQELVSASGKVFPQTEVKISSDVSGEVVELYVEEGDSVRAGQLLAKIDADAVESQVARGVANVNSSKAQVANANAQIASLEAQKAQIEAQLINAREIYERNKGLATDGVVSQADLETSESSLRALEANLEAAESNIKGAKESARAAQYGVESAQATLSELRTSLRQTTIYAPMGGVVSLLNVEEGERVVGTIQMAGTELMRIANLNAMEVRVEVSENDVPSVKIGDVAEIEVDAYLNRTFKGRVTQIANSSTTAGTAAGDVLNSDQVTNFEVRINIDPDSYQDLVASGNTYPFRPGMSAGVDVLTKSANGVISVPIESVTTRQKETDDDLGTDDLEEVVFVVRGDTVDQVAVATGLQDSRVIEVTTGLSAGDQVVAGPYTELSRKLERGKKVVVKDKDTFYSDKE
ncbi:MAG: efflux RND transporter periplasmic adaptor subunit [Bacteroidota bacterium]